MIECISDWGKLHGTMRKTKRRGLCRVADDFLLNLVGYNLIRLPKIISAWETCVRMTDHPIAHQSHASTPTYLHR
jgi:hypothetical protein